MGYEFDGICDWSYLADYFDITVNYSMVQETIGELHERDLFVFTVHCDDWIEVMEERSMDEIGLYCFYDEHDVYRDIKLHKLKALIGKAAVEILNEKEQVYENVDGEEMLNVCRSFVEQWIESNELCSTAFWEKVLEIEDDYIFMDSLQRNLEDLWW